MTRARPRVQIVALCFVQFLVALEFSIVNVGLPAIGADLLANEQQLQWVLSGYALALGAGLLAGGRLADAAGPRKALLLGMLGFAIASLAAAAAPSFWALVTCRVGQGAAAALATPAALAAITTLLTGRDRVRALSWWGAGASLGFAMGAVLGGVLSDVFGWRAIFVACSGLAMTAAILIIVALPPIAPSLATRPDWLGAAQIGVGAAALIAACAAMQDAAAQPLPVLAWAAVALTLTGTVLARNRRNTFALIPASFLRRRSVLTANLIGAGAAAAGGSMVYFATAFMQDTLGWSQIFSGLMLLPDAAAAAVGARVAGPLVARIGVTPTTRLGIGSIGVGMLVLAGTPANGSAVLVLILGTCLVGFGLVLVGVVATIQAASELTDGEHGLSGGLLVTTQQFGVAAGLALLILASHPAEGPMEYRDAFIAGAALAACIWLALKISDRQVKQISEALRRSP